MNLYGSVDVRHAVASVEADRVRELAKVEAQEGGADAVNSLARGAIAGAEACMERRDLLAEMADLDRAFATWATGL